jgi:hypothetical protein
MLVKVASGAPVPTPSPVFFSQLIENPCKAGVPTAATERAMNMGTTTFPELAAFHSVGELVRVVLIGIAAAAPERAVKTNPCLVHS